MRRENGVVFGSFHKIDFATDKNGRQLALSFVWDSSFNSPMFHPGWWTRIVDTKDFPGRRVEVLGTCRLISRSQRAEYLNFLRRFDQLRLSGDARPVKNAAYDTNSSLVLGSKEGMAVAQSKLYRGQLWSLRR